MSGGKTIFSGEPLPVAPPIKDPELNAFHRKLIDYLRRLTGKLNQYVGAGNGLETFVTTIAGEANATLGSDWAPIDWTLDIRKDAVYEHSISSNQEQITVLLAGLYIILCDLWLDTGPTFPVSTRVVILDPEGFVEYGFTELGAEGSLSMAVPVVLKADKVIRIDAKDSGGGGDFLKTRGCRLTILRVALDDSGGTSDTPGIGWDDDDRPSWLPPLVEA